MYYSLNDGQSWEKLKANLPAVPVVDMKIKDVDLVIATNGRGFWILDEAEQHVRVVREERPRSG